MITTSIKKVFAGCLVFCGMAITFTACSDEFLAEKRPFGSYGENDIYSNWESVKLRLNYLYQGSLPAFRDYNGEPNKAQGGNNTATNNAPDIWPVGLPDFLSTNADEFAGYGNRGYGYYCDPATIWSYTNIHKFFYLSINDNPWKKMRECTDVIVKVRLHDGLTDLQRNWAEGQARFLRATRYFRLFKRFGGTPVISNLQSTVQSDTTDLRVSRQSTRDTYDFIISDLTTAAQLLPARWEEEVNDWGRITSGAAYALAGYVANYYASPVFNRQDDQARWQQAYELNTLAIQKLDEGHFGMSYEGDPGNNASNWAKIWTNIYAGESQKSEAVYMAICNNTSGDAGDQLYNCTENKLRPSNCGGAGGISPSAEMIDAFPMADGKRPTEAGQYTYDKKLFFLNRDPRFYRTFAFPGSEWQFSGSITADLAGQCPYFLGSEYKLHNYAWYDTDDHYANQAQSGYYGDLLQSGGLSVYVRKKSQDYGLGVTPMYVFESTGVSDKKAFQRNGQPMVAMRYTEVLLNLAEAACGTNRLGEAYAILQRIRQRVGYTGDCGLDPSIQADRAKMFEAILYERKIELAYEGKRFDDCHRWMLFDGGVNQGEIGGSTWIPSGWSGNTCEYLGVKPLNDSYTYRVEVAFDPAFFKGSYEPSTDPFATLGINKPTAVKLTEDFTTETNPDTGDVTYHDARVQALAEFYGQYLVRKDILTQTTVDTESGAISKPKWSNNCYLMGLNSGDQSANPNVAQTLGWTSAFGGEGRFDPLSETPDTSAQ